MNYVHAQNLIDKGRGKAALRLGQPYDVYRLQPNAAQNFLDPVNRIATGVLILRRPDRSLANVEGTLLTLVPWETVGDFRNWLVGDVFLQNDEIFGEGYTLVDYSSLEFDAFCLAFHGPVKKTMGARLDRTCRIIRPLETGTDPNGYLSGDISKGAPLKLANGKFVFGSQSEAITDGALIPVGFASHTRARGDILSEIPSTTGVAIFMLYLPPLPGYTVREGDRIEAGDGSRYVVQNPYEQEAGMAGSQITCTRQVSQP